MGPLSTEIAAARTRIQGHIRQTPVMTARLGGQDIALKLEHLQLSGSFKARGAFNNLLSRDIPPAGVVAASGGNHGAAVGFAAAALGVRARVYVPEIAGPVKIGLIRSSGAECVVVPGAYSEALEAALAHERESGAVQLHAYDSAATVAGQGTLFAEWSDQGLEADTVLIAVGGGGLIAGAMGWFGNGKRIVAVEPELAPTLSAALERGPEAEVEVSGVAANALGARRIGRIAHDLAQAHLHRSILLPDAAISAAQGVLWNDLRLAVEPAGAAALAAILSGAYRPEPGERVAVLICGGNLGHDPLDRSA